MTKGILGAQLIGGCTRRVHIYLPDPHYVVKVHRQEGSEENRLEYDNYLFLLERGLGDWIAKPKMISDNLLIMERTTPPISDKEYPAEVPNYFFDLKYVNWGMLNGRVVCHDYNRLHKHKDGSMVKAEWTGLWYYGKYPTGERG